MIPSIYSVMTRGYISVGHGRRRSLAFAALSRPLFKSAFALWPPIPSDMFHVIFQIQILNKTGRIPPVIATLAASEPC
jgi:hypothetical protein